MEANTGLIRQVRMDAMLRQTPGLNGRRTNVKNACFSPKMQYCRKIIKILDFNVCSKVVLCQEPDKECDRCPLG
uniref:Uncharacterized protein n=1 Tax=Romanomermis culicivorax TaxID=13658 RepID=A0A915JVU2_ROMCU